jgi:hypothetical protein
MIGGRHGTDKTSIEHGYLNFYEQFFHKFRNDKIKILEIGVKDGASLFTWRDFFCNATIIGIDIDCNAKRYEGYRIFIEIADQSDVEQLTKIALKYGAFDLIIEDGSHKWEHQLTSFKTLFPFVSDTGFYICEDLHSNYGNMIKTYQGVASSTCMNYLKQLCDFVVGYGKIDINIEDPFLRTYGKYINQVTFIKHACIIQKNYFPRFGVPLLPLKKCAINVRVMAHLDYICDRLGESCYVNIPGQLAFQGILLSTAKNILQYRVLDQEENWSEWVNENTFLGTRGKSLKLLGITVRLSKDAETQYTLRVAGRFQKEMSPIVVGSNEDCVSPAMKPLCGLQVEILDK